MKDSLVHILKATSIEFKRRCEQNTDEVSRDIYGDWHSQIENMIYTIERGGVK